MDERVTVFGEVVAVEGEDMQVRLDTNELAVLHDAGEQSPPVGYRGEFTVEGHLPDGRMVVSVGRPSGDAEDATAFDLEFDRLHSALAGRRAGQRSQASSPGSSRSLQEEHVRSWIERVGTTLGQLRKHRAKRSTESDES